MPGRYRRDKGSTGRSAIRRFGLIGCSTVVSFGLVGVLSTTPPDVQSASGEIGSERHDDDPSRSGERVVRWIGGIATRPDLGSSGPTSAPTSQPTVEPTRAPDRKPEAVAPLPAASGSGKRVVFDITGQQVWLVGADGAAKRTYMVSGSRFDQLPTGTFEVFSKSRNTTSWHGTETMEYMVRFFHGENAAIGFHDIPVRTSSGDEVQTLSELGAPLSDGCIRQAEGDAKALWNFTEVGSTVVVVRT